MLLHGVASIRYMVLSERAVRRDTSAQPFVVLASGAPYFECEGIHSWTPVGQNDAITWPDLAGLYRRRDLESAESYIRLLAEHGVTCLRLMMEYSQTGYRYFERRAGSFNRDMVRLWDDLFDLCRMY